MSADEILFERRRGLGLVRLNRPQALNALTLDMTRRLDRALKDWAADPQVRLVAIRGVGERAFCAGGDVRALYREGPGSLYTEIFYREEYALNRNIFRFPKPYVALIDGIVMGGGVGISAHGSHRVVTERTLFAMPETGIGLFPDVGATYVLPRLHGALGMYLGLTGARLNAADCVWARIGSCHVPADRLDALEDALAGADFSADAHGTVDRVLARFRTPPGPAPLAQQSDRIDSSYGQRDLRAVLKALGDEKSGWGEAQLAQLSTKSPTSLAVTFRQLREGAALDFDDAMRLEYRLVPRFLAGHDFREGVRALIIDKDGRPRWRPSRLEEVSPTDVEDYFRPLPAGELQLNGPAGG
jgi:enoyl-CoA hydratase